MRNSVLHDAIHQALQENGTATVTDEPPRRRDAVDLIASQPWAMTPDALETLLSIARRENGSPDAVAAKLGRPLQNTRAVTVRDGVAVIPVTGPVFRYANLFTEVSGATSLEILARDFTAAVEDSQVRAVVLDIDSPGGQATGIGDFAQMVRASPKHVTAFVGGMGASAAYWIAAAADEVVISATGEVGSIGAVLGVYRKRADGDAVEFVSSQSPHKRPDPESDAGASEYQTRVDSLADVFVSDVAQYRGVDSATVIDKFGGGGVRTGAMAVSLGMADRVGTLESTLAGLAGSNRGGMPTMAANTTGQPAAETQPEITRAYLDEHHADLVASIREEGWTDGRATGAEAERDRIQSVETQLIPGHEALIADLKFDGKTTGEQAAVQVLAAEKKSRTDHLAKHRSDAPAPLPNAEPGDEGATAADFESEVNAKQSAGLSRVAAIKSVASEQPGLHRAWITKINQR